MGIRTLLAGSAMILGLAAYSTVALPSSKKDSQSPTTISQRYFHLPTSIDSTIMEAFESNSGPYTHDIESMDNNELVDSLMFNRNSLPWFILGLKCLINQDADQIVEFSGKDLGAKVRNPRSAATLEDKLMTLRVDTGETGGVYVELSQDVSLPVKVKWLNEMELQVSRFFITERLGEYDTPCIDCEIPGTYVRSFVEHKVQGKLKLDGAFYKRLLRGLKGIISGSHSTIPIEDALYMVSINDEYAFLFRKRGNDNSQEIEMYCAIDNKMKGYDPDELENDLPSVMRAALEYGKAIVEEDFSRSSYNHRVENIDNPEIPEKYN